MVQPRISAFFTAAPRPVNSEDRSNSAIPPLPASGKVVPAVATTSQTRNQPKRKSSTGREEETSDNPIVISDSKGHPEPLSAKKPKPQQGAGGGGKQQTLLDIARKRKMQTVDDPLEEFDSPPALPRVHKRVAPASGLAAEAQRPEAIDVDVEHDDGGLQEMQVDKTEHPSILAMIQRDPARRKALEEAEAAAKAAKEAEEAVSDEDAFMAMSDDSSSASLKLSDHESDDCNDSDE
jgi:hypothetical protein